MALNAAFYAYASDPPDVVWSITAALKERDQSAPLPIITPWPKAQVIGLRLDDQLRDRIASSDLLVADITVPNFNVFYEIGYAIGRGKPIFLTVNNSIEHALWPSLTRENFIFMTSNMILSD